MPRTILVLPFFNEERRLNAPALAGLATADPGLGLLLVDDGSTDRTPQILAELCRRSGGKASTLRLARNQGRAEAVRTGLLHALAQGADAVGYADGDLAAPPDEILRVWQEFNSVTHAVVMGSRVRLMGAKIERRATRYYLGRLFAVAASYALGATIYDTQCGLKFFRDKPALRSAMARPFRDRWSFDVELLARLLAGNGSVSELPPDEFLEIPLRAWRDVPGSKLTIADMVRSGFYLVPTALRLRLRSWPGALTRSLG